jgi:nucleotide-binding universal stress UspA family protein
VAVALGPLGDEAGDVKTEQAKPGTVVVGVDGSDHADRAAAWAAEQAVLEGRPLAVVHVRSVDDIPSGVWAGYAGATLPSMPEPLTVARAVVDAATAPVRQSWPALEVIGLPRVGDARQQLVELSRTAHLMVVGSRGRGTFASMVLGSVSVSVAKHAKCPVVVTRPGPAGVVSNGVLVGADGTPESLPVIEFAFRQASLRQLPLTVMHTSFDIAAAVAATHGAEPATTTDDLRMLLSESVAGMWEKFPDVHVTTELGVGLADECLTRSPRPRDLIVVGRQPTTLISTLLASSVSTSVLERANCPVAVVPEAESSC